MRIFLAVAGTVVLLFGACVAMVVGILAFTPTTSCDTSTTGACAYGQLPMTLVLIGTPVVVVCSVLATWVRALARPRAAFPYLGIVLVVLVFTIALSLAG
jgi:hypothetical protein